MTVIWLARSLAIVCFLAVGTVLAADRSEGLLLARVRAANERFKDVSVAIAEGYTRVACASSNDGGSKGIRYVNARYLADDAIDLARPEALMYERRTGGSLALAGVEYISARGPVALEGHLFTTAGARNRYGLGPFYELPVWAWRANPSGAHAATNPSIACEHVAAK